MHKKFIRDGRDVVTTIAAAMPSRLPSDMRAEFATDLLLRLLFLHIARAAGHHSELLAGLEIANIAAPHSPSACPTIFRRLLQPVLYDAEPIHSSSSEIALHILLPPPELPPSAVAAIDITDDAIAALTGPNGLVNRYTFTPREPAAADNSTAIGPSALADLIERLSPDRRTRGAYYTPPDVVDFVVREALVQRLGGFRPLIFENDGTAITPRDRSIITSQIRSMRILDPACGGGAFLVAALRILYEITVALNARWTIIRPPCFGADIDPRAVGVTRLRLWLAMARRGLAPDVLTILNQIIIADTLTNPPTLMQYTPFALILTNPPFGLKCPVPIRNALFDPKTDGAQSRDAYALFLAKASSLLNPGGIAGFVVADTWRTIKSHLPLRRRLLAQTQLLHIIDLPGRTFDATVGAEIVILRNASPDTGTTLHVTDLRGGNDHDFSGPTTLLNSITPTYTYPQSLCTRHSRAPVFIASPNVFRLMTDPSLTPLGTLAEIRHGLTTGDTRRFIYKRPGTLGRYPDAPTELVLGCPNLADLLNDTERQHGFNPARFDNRYLIPYDKGGPSRSADGWLPCYHVPTDYYIDWRADSVAEMKRLPGFRHDGRAFYFRRGITFSHTGHYAPTFRLGAGTVFDTAGSTLFPHTLDLRLLLALLNSKTVRYLFKNYVNHSVNTAENPLKEIPLPQPDASCARVLISLVDEIVRQQRSDRYYPFHRHEHVEIDRIVYKLYGLTESEIDEVENWLLRRYPLLATKPA